MSDENAIDQCLDLQHPREVFEFFGNKACETLLAEALERDKLHHALILCGPKGIGKATLAYRLARRYLGAASIGDSPLASDPEDKVCKLIANGAHQDLRTATRYCPDKKDIRANITIAAIRALTQMFELRASNELGRRVAIIDCADEMRTEGANALLKTLEEPPKGGLIILLANSLGAILPTIRSRCRIMRLEPLSDKEMRAALPEIDNGTLALSYGRIGRAKSLAEFEVQKLYSLISEHLSGLPNAPQKPAFDLANSAKDMERLNLIIELLKDWLLRTTKAGIGIEITEVEPGENATLARLAKPKNGRLIADTITKIESLRLAANNNLDKPSIVLESLNHIRAALR